MTPSKLLYLEKTWKQTLEWFPGHTDINSDMVLNQLVVLYSDPKRHYHTLDHIHRSLKEVDKYKSDIPYPDVVRMAIFFHDAIFSFTPSDEQNSSLFFKKTIGEYLECTESVCEMIEQSANHLHHNNPSLGQSTNFFMDIDLISLGDKSIRASSKAIQKEYFDFHPVPQEYKHQQWKMYTEGRIAFFETLLAKESIYRVSSIKNRLEEKARENISDEIKEMKNLLRGGEYS